MRFIPEVEELEPRDYLSGLPRDYALDLLRSAERHRPRHVFSARHQVVVNQVVQHQPPTSQSPRTIIMNSARVKNMFTKVKAFVDTTMIWDKSLPDSAVYNKSFLDAMDIFKQF